MKLKHRNQCALQKLSPASEATPVRETVVSRRYKPRLTQWQSNCEEPHTSQYLCPDQPYHATTHSARPTYVYVGRAGVCSRVIWPVRAKVLRGVRFFAVRLPLCRASCRLPDRKLSLTGVASLAELSSCKAYWFLVCRRLASVKDFNRRSLNVVCSLWLWGLPLPGPGLPPSDGLVVWYR